MLIVLGPVFQWMRLNVSGIGLSVTETFQVSRCTMINYTILGVDLDNETQIQAFGRTLRRMGVFFTRLMSNQPAACASFSKHERLTIDALEVLGACSMGAIAQHLGLGQSTITPLVDRLENQKIVRRIRSKQDRRVWLVELTNKGKKASAAIDESFQAIALEMLHPLSETERITLIELLDRVNAPREEDRA